MLSPPNLNLAVYLIALAIGLVSLAFLGLFVAQSFRLVARLNHQPWLLAHPRLALPFAFLFDLGGLLLAALLLLLPAVLIEFGASSIVPGPPLRLLWPSALLPLAGVGTLAVLVAILVHPTRRLLVYYLLFGLLLFVAVVLGSLTVVTHYE